MYVAELLIPGTWLDLEDRDLTHRADVLLRTVVIKGLDEAAIALHLFRTQRGAGVIGREAFLQRMKDRTEAMPRLDQLSNDRSLSPEEIYSAINQARVESEITSKRERWEAGEIPRGYLHSIPFIHARTFVFSIDTVRKGLQALANELKPTHYAYPIRAILEGLDKSLPNLFQVRDTAHHHEDRVRFRKRGGERVETSRVDLPGFVKAPSGNMLLDSLHGDVYVTTMSDGNVGEVPITEDALNQVQVCVQRVLDQLPWNGPTEHHPHH